ncbi:MAG TPA: ABC transporter substrate-binding protein [Candidatus Dormibacteraeota bacterium]|jgi:branched-chain amino acid transport system substrate-binding protein|nr:ABC transporter substrate-binding protein [Candidatus Dormibacteraeota bacterium]
MASKLARPLFLGAAVALVASACGSSNNTTTGGGASTGASTAAAVKATGTPISLGWVGTMSGSQAGVIAVEKQELGGAQAYFGWLNDHGGVDNHPVQISIADDAGDPNTGLAGAKRLVEQENVQAMMFVSGGPIASAVQPYLVSKSIPLLGTAAPLLCFFQPVQKYTFGELTPYEYQGSALAQYLVKTKGAKTVAYAGFNDVSGKSFGQSFLNTARSLGATVTGTSYFNRGQTDFAAYISTLQGQKPDAVGFFASIQETAAVLKAAQTSGFQTTWAWGPGGTNPALVQLAGPLAEGTYGVSPYLSDTSSDQSVKDYRAALTQYQPSITSGPYTQFGYVLGRATADALKKASGTYTSEAVRTAMESLSGNYGMFPAFQLSATNHLLNRGIQVVQYKGSTLQSASQLINVDPTSVTPYPCAA